MLISINFCFFYVFRCCFSLNNLQCCLGDELTGDSRRDVRVSNSIVGSHHMPSCNGVAEKVGNIEHNFQVIDLVQWLHNAMRLFVIDDELLVALDWFCN